MHTIPKEYNSFEVFAVKVFQKLFESQNIEIIHTRYGSDGGKDGDGINKFSIGDFQEIQRYWIEAKQRNKSNLKLHDIGKTLILVFNKGINSVYIVTNRNFDPQAVRESRNFSNKSDKKVFLVNGQELMRLAQQVEVGIPKNLTIAESNTKKNRSEIEVISSFYPNPNNNYTDNLKISSNGIAYILVNIDLDSYEIRDKNLFLKCNSNNSNVEIFPAKFKIPKNAIGSISKQFAILCNHNELSESNLDLDIQILDDNEIIHRKKVKNHFTIKTPILPKIKTDSFISANNEILSDINIWEKDSSIKNILIKAEAGVGKSFLLNNIRHEIHKKGYSEILLDGESHKYPVEVVQSIFRGFFPLPEESFSEDDKEDIKFILSNSDIDIKIINYISDFLCNSNHKTNDQETNLEFLAEVIASLLLKFSINNKKQIFIYEDLHKADVSVIFFLEEIQRIIRKRVKENRILFILTSRESRSVQDVKSTSLWIERFEALYSNDFIKTISLKSIDKKEATEILHNIIPTLNKHLCEKIVEQGGSTPFYIKEYIGLMLQDDLIKINTNTNSNYLLINPLGLKKYIDEEKFLTPTKERLITIYNRYNNTRIKDFLSLAASIGKRFNAEELFELTERTGLNDALSKCFELELIRRSDYEPDFYLFDHDIIRYTILDNLNAIEHAQYSKLILKNLDVDTNQKIKLLYQSGNGTACFQILKEELRRIKNNPGLYYTNLQWKQLAINIIDHSFFKKILSEYKDLLLNDWDYVFYSAPVCSIFLDPLTKSKVLKDLLLSMLKTLLDVSSGSDNLADRIISEGLMIAKQSSDSFYEATIRYYFGYLLLERNDVARSIDEHKKVLKLITNCQEHKEITKLAADNILRLAICYRKIGEFNQSRKLLLEGLKLSQRSKKTYYIGFRGNFAATFFYTNPKRHQKYYLRTLEITEKFKLKHQVARTHLQLGISYFRFDSFQKSKTEFEIAKKMFDTLQSTNEEVRYNLNWGCYQLVVEGNFPQSEILLKKAEEIALRQRNERRLWRIYSNLATIYESNNDIRKALEYDILALNIILTGLDFNNDIVEKVILYNRERCALINIFIRIEKFPEYSNLIVRLKKEIGEKLFIVLKEDAQQIIDNNASEVSLHMGSFFKELSNGILRAIIME